MLDLDASQICFQFIKNSNYRQIWNAQKVLGMESSWYRLFTYFCPLSVFICLEVEQAMIKLYWLVYQLNATLAARGSRMFSDLCS